MKIYNCEQGSDEWRRLRMGIPTASQFHRLMPPLKRKPTEATSAKIRGYMHELLVEWFLGVPYDEGKSGFMQRGTEAEDDGVSAYEFEHGVTCVKVGFVTNDEGTFGCSPDRLVGNEGLYSGKAHGAKEHVRLLLEGDDEEDYMWQSQGEFLVTGRRWCDRRRHYPMPEVFPSITTRIERDDELVALLCGRLTDFLALYEDAKRTLEAKGCHRINLMDRAAEDANEFDAVVDNFVAERDAVVGGGVTDVEAAMEFYRPAIEDLD